MLLKSSTATTLHPSVCQQLASEGLGIKPNVMLSRNFMFNGAVHVEGPSKLFRAKIDCYSYVQFNCTITTSSIGRYCSIAHGVEMGMGIHKTDCATTSVALFNNRYFQSFSGPIESLPKWKLDLGEETSSAQIGNDVWIGAHVLIPANCKIGHGAVIGAGSVVTGDVPPYAVVAGNNVVDDNGKVSSMRIAKYRFTDEIIADLLDLNWWDYDLPKWVSKGHKVPYENIDDFISYMRNEDLSECPRIVDDWKMLFIQDKENVRILNVAKDTSQDFTNLNIEE